MTVYHLGAGSDNMTAEGLRHPVSSRLLSPPTLCPSLVFDLLLPCHHVSAILILSPVTFAIADDHYNPTPNDLVPTRTSCQDRRQTWSLRRVGPGR